MLKVDLIKPLEPAAIFGTVVGITAAFGIWGSRYVSKVPYLPIKTAGVMATAAFISLYFKMCFESILSEDGNKAIPWVYEVELWGIAIINCACLTIYGSRYLVDRDISSDASFVMAVWAQIGGLVLIVGALS